MPIPLQGSRRCPLCPDHQDTDFVWESLLGTYVCLGCSHEINNGFDFEEQPSPETYNCADTIERLLAYLGISYEAARQRWLADAGKSLPSDEEKSR